MNSVKDKNNAFSKILPPRQYCFNSRLTPLDATDAKRSTIVCSLGKDAFRVPEDQDCLMSVITAEVPSTTSPFQTNDNQTFYLSTTNNIAAYNTTFTSAVQTIPDTTYILLKSCPNTLIVNTLMKPDTTGGGLTSGTTYFVKTVETPVTISLWTQVGTTVTLTITAYGAITFNSTNYYVHIYGASSLGVPDGAYQTSASGSTTSIVFTSPTSNTQVTSGAGVSVTLCRISLSTTLGGSTMALTASSPTIIFTCSFSAACTLGFIGDTTYTNATIASTLNNKTLTLISGTTTPLTATLSGMNQLTLSVGANYYLFFPLDIPQIGAYPTLVGSALGGNSVTFAQVPYINPKYFIVRSPDMQTMYSQPIAKIQNDVASGNLIFYQNFSQFDTRILSTFVQTFQLQLQDENGNPAHLHGSDWSINVQFKFIPKQNLEVM